MKYSEKSLTREGATMLALSDKEGKALLLDGMIVSEKVITAGTDISTLTMDSFTDSVQFPVNGKVQSENQFTVRSIITNHYQDTAGTDHDITKEFTVALIGVVAHVEGYADQHVLTVAVGDDPFVLPAYQGTPFNLVLGVTQAYSPTQNITVKIDNSAYALAMDVDDLKTKIANLETSVNVTVEEKLKDAASLSKSNHFKEATTFDKAPTDADGNAYVTAKDAQAKVDAGVKTSAGDATTKATSAQTAAEKYADAVATSHAASAITTAAEHADSGDASTLTAANAHADSTAKSTASTALLDSKKYTDNAAYVPTDSAGNALINGVKLGVNSENKLEYGDNLVLMANKPQAPGFTTEMDFSVGKPQWTVMLPKIDGGASIVSATVQYRKSGDAGWTSIQSAVTTLTGHVTGLTGNSEYEFRAFVTNYAGDSPYSEVMTVKTMDDRIFGASWDMSSDPKLTRTDAAVGLVAGINGAQNDFDAVGPWAKMDKTITDDKGNSFVRIPKLYIKKTQTDKLATWQVSLSKIDDTWYLPKCFWDFTNQKELDYVDVGRYQGTVASGLLQSKSDVMATTSQTISAFRTQAKANGVGYQLLDIHIVDVWQVLFLIEFATLNSQSIMNGNLSGGAELKNGTGSSHAGSSGFATNTGNMDYRGIENMYGNLYQWVDGVNITSYKAWVCDDSSKYQSDLLAAPYQALNYTSSANGYISKMGYDPSHPFAQFATAVGGSDSAYYSDYQYTNSGNVSVLYGDNWNGTAGNGGAFHWDLDNAASGSYTFVGSRLVRKALS